MPRGYKVGDGAAQPRPFSIFRAKNGQVGVRIGGQGPYESVVECSLSGVGYVLVTATPDGVCIQGEGVVRVENGVAAITS